MMYTATTIWEGTPEALLKLIEASKASAPIHESLGAKNPRILQAVLGGQSDRLHYCIDLIRQRRTASSPTVWSHLDGWQGPTHSWRSLIQT